MNSVSAHDDPNRTTPRGLIRYASEFYAAAEAADEVLGSRPGYEMFAPIREVLVIAIQCALALVGVFVLLVGLTTLIPFRISTWMEFAILLFAIHFAAWRYGVRTGALLKGDQLTWLAAGCALAFVAFDRLILGMFRSAGSLAGELDGRAIAIAIVTVTLCVLETVVMVYVTVPYGQRLYGRARVA